VNSEALQQMTTKKNRRLWVNRRLQGTLAVRLLIHWTAFIVVAFSLMFTYHFLADPLQPARVHLQRVFAAHFHFLAVALVMLPAFIYDSLQISNRFAGPIVRVRRLVQGIGTGEPVERLAFRKGDFWHELSRDINAMLDRLEATGAITTIPDDEGKETRPPAAADRAPDTRKAFEQSVRGPRDLNPVS
jgi:hypothetical protein